MHKGLGNHSQAFAPMGIQLCPLLRSGPAVPPAGPPYRGVPPFPSGMDWWPFISTWEGAAAGQNAGVL